MPESTRGGFSADACDFLLGIASDFLSAEICDFLLTVIEDFLPGVTIPLGVTKLLFGYSNGLPGLLPCFDFSSTFVYDTALLFFKVSFLFGDVPLLADCTDSFLLDISALESPRALASLLPLNV